WFTIERFDDNIKQFYSYFVHALNQLDIISCPASIEAVTQNQFPNLINLFTLLINELSAVNIPISLVLDDYHHIKNPDIHQGISFFIRNMPEKWQLLICSRTTPPFPVSNLRISQQLFEISETELAFTDLETEEFFSQSTKFDCDPKTQQRLRQSVDGWPTALQLVAILSKDSNSFNVCAEQISKSNHAYLWDYLEEEVFSALTEKLQTLLLTIAPLNKVDASIVNELCSISDGQEQLELLQEQGAFIIAVNDLPGWFVFHSFFKAFLIHKSRQTIRFKCDHKKIAEIWLARENIEEALPHALASQDEQLLIALLKEHGWQLFNDGQLISLDRCFSLIEEDIWDYPELLLLKAWMLQSQQQSYKILPLIEKAKSIFNAQKIILSTQQENELTIIEAQTAINQGKVEDALELAKRTLLSTAHNSTRVNIVARAIIGEAYHYLGNLPLAYQYFQEVKQFADEQHLQQNIIWSLYQQAEILQTQNNPSETERHIDAAISLANKYHLQKLPLYIYLLHFKERQAYQKSDFEAAEHLCRHALKIASPYGEQWCFYTYALQAKIALAKNDLPQCTQLMAEIDKPLHYQNLHSDGIATANYVRIEYWRATNDIKAIKHWLNRAPKPKHAFNHLDQSHKRNQIRAFMELNELQLALQLSQENINDAQQCGLITELNRDLILLSCIESKLKQFNHAKAHLLQAIEYSLQTGLTTCFIREANELTSLYQELAKDPSLNHALKNKLTHLLSLSGVRLYEPPKNPFDSDSLIRLQTHSQLPRLVKNIPLTSREWQVLGFIHSGYSNQQIAKTIRVAPTTVKSHIRNIYQKWGLRDRSEALQLSAELAALIS
ncbi:MAG: HTH-type transcriptional regulator MalT, partial [Psychromonas sp.]|nr:HTH-type transcriptional regulator MalT [Psychromonas sp.]